MALIALGCGGGLDGGTITSKDHRDGYYNTVIVPFYTGEDCETYGKTTECTPRYMYIPQQQYVAPVWWVNIEANCKTNNGQQTCDQATKYVSEEDYNSANVGDWFGATPVPSAEIAHGG